jgi:mono/diheme cytochrome c family protein
MANDPVCGMDVTNKEGMRFMAQIMLFLILWIIQAAISPVYAAKAGSTETQQIKRGKVISNKFCSLCHGKNLEGQPDWRTRNDDGKLPAPPLNGTGHTWHHADELLFGIIKKGLVPPFGPPNYKTDMPAWESTLSDEDIWAVLAYIKSRWPAEAQKIQKEINQESFKRL